MCGIIGFSGQGNLREIIGRGLEDLEYRGYDSCGFTLAAGGTLVTEKKAGPGMIRQLAGRLPERADGSCLVIAHTRWATHGKIRARGGAIFTVTDCDNREIRRLSRRVLPVPSLAEKRLAPVLTVVPLQLLACHAARLRGCDADRPRNLAKSVTVE